VTNWNITNQNSIVISDSTISFSNPCLAVGSVYLQDIGSLNSSSDIEINFTIPKNTTQISEFRIYFVKENNTDDFNLEIADELPEQNFISVDISEVTEEEYSFAIAEGVLDVNEEPVVKDQEYIVFVVSVANGITANYNAISDPSPRFIFGEPFYFQTGMKYGDNINYFDIDGEFIVYSSGWPEEVTKELDINSDGINDISFIAYSGSSPSYSATGASIQTSDYTSVCIIESDYLNYLPEHLSINDNMIWNTGHLTFRNQGFSPNSPNYTNGVWQNDIPAYMISRTVTDNDTIFAWFKVSIYTKYNAKINIHDYAVYGESINTEEIFPINFTICPNPSTGIVNITFENYTNPIEFEIYDISGRVILHDVAKLKYHSLDLSYLSKGMYFIKTNSIKQSAVKFILN